MQRSREALWRRSVVCPMVQQAHGTGTISFHVAWADLTLQSHCSRPFKVSLEIMQLNLPGAVPVE